MATGAVDISVASPGSPGSSAFGKVDPPARASLSQLHAELSAVWFFFYLDFLIWYMS